MRKFLVLAFFSVLLSSSSWVHAYVAVPVADWTGSRSTTGTNEITATAQWLTDGFKVSWNITESSGVYTYVYNFSRPSAAGAAPLALTKGLSHAIIEVSAGDDLPDVSVNNADQDPAQYTSSDGNSNPGMPGAGVWGVKWDVPEGNANPYVMTIVTERDPVWGSFYAKDGVDNNQGVKTDVVAWNYNFLTDPDSSTTDFSGWIPTPDSGENPVPEPATMALFGLGLGGMAFIRRRI